MLKGESKGTFCGIGIFRVGIIDSVVTKAISARVSTIRDCELKENWASQGKSGEEGSYPLALFLFVGVLQQLKAAVVVGVG